MAVWLLAAGCTQDAPATRPADASLGAGGSGGQPPAPAGSGGSPSVPAADVPLGTPRDAGTAAPDTSGPAPDLRPPPADVPPPTAMNGWLPGYTRRLPISIEAGNATALTDFPVLIRLAPAAFDHAGAAPAGKDLRITDAAGTVLAHEIESWDAMAGSLVWVRVPTLPAGGKATLWLFYGNPAAAERPEAETRQTWRDAVGVWHLAGTAKDSSPTALMLSKPQSTPPTFGAGYLGKGLMLGDGLQPARIAEVNNLPGGLAAITFSAWARPSTFDDGGGEGELNLLAVGAPPYSGHAVLSFELHSTTATLTELLAQAAPRPCHDDPCMAKGRSDMATYEVNKWMFLTVVLDLAADTFTFYRDGAMVGTPKKANFGATSFPPEVAVPMTGDAGALKYSSGAFIGATGNGCCARYKGLIDEVRLEKVARSADWIATAYRSMASPDFAVLGAEQKM